MNDATLGKIIEGEAQRDAIHIAIAPVIAAHAMIPGQHVGLLPDGRASAKGVDKTIGVVDPFLSEAVPMGATFWLCLYQKTVTGMRHHWSHPAFECVVQTNKKAESEAWLRKFCNENDCPPYDIVIAAAVGRHVPLADDIYGEAYRIEDYGYGPSLFFAGRDAHSQIPPEFWEHVEIVTGEKVPTERRATSFSCSC